MTIHKSRFKSIFQSTTLSLIRTTTTTTSTSTSTASSTRMTPAKAFSSFHRPLHYLKNVKSPTLSLYHPRFYSSSISIPFTYNKSSLSYQPSFIPTSSYTTSSNPAPLSPPPLSPPPTPPSSSNEQILNSNSNYTSTMYRALFILILTGGGLWYFFELKKQKIEKEKAERDANKEYGRPSIGGAFELIDTEGRKKTDQDFVGRFMLVYFGFTHCPDICPEELEKMGDILNLLPSSYQSNCQLVFITCDPLRDTPSLVKAYLNDFHPTFIGLTGTYDQIRSVAKKYRVYFSSPATLPECNDYLVDHSIFMYLMDPQGQFVDAFGKNLNAHQIKEKIIQHMENQEKNKK